MDGLLHGKSENKNGWFGGYPHDLGNLQIYNDTLGVLEGK